MATTMTYGSYNFTPVPLVRFSKTYQRSEDGTRLGSLFNMTLDGVLTPIPGNNGGIINTIALQDTFRDAFIQDGCLFHIACDGTTLWSGYPIVGNPTFDRTSNNWVETIAYSLDLQFNIEGSGEDLSSSPFIESATENWSLEFSDVISKFSWKFSPIFTESNPYVLNMTHNISAKGKRHFTDCETMTKQPWEYAREYVTSKLSTGSDENFNIQLEGSGVVNLSSALFTGYNHARIQQTDQLGGSYSINETWLVLENKVGFSFPGRGIEDFTITTDTSVNNGITTVNINGNIQGVETRSYGSVPGDFSVTESKYTTASGYWIAAKTRLYVRANLIYKDITTIRNLNTIPLSTSVGHSLSQGRITYNYTYDNRPSNCITGAFSEVISINDNNPTDVFAQIAVLGRAIGPVLQDVSTITLATRSISIETVGKPQTLCTAAGLRTVTSDMKTDIETLLCGWETELTDVYEQVFKQIDTESWNPKDGRYSRNVEFAYMGCTVTGVTSFC